MDYSTYYQAQPYVVFQPPAAAAAAAANQSTGIPAGILPASGSEESFRNANGSPANSYGTNYDAFAAFDKEILAAQGQAYNLNANGEEHVPGLNRSSSEEKELTPQQSVCQKRNLLTSF
ncbi:hypothetical protein AA313_de0201363 [Arthrobotrys entomopaga]|nr:hypothetical protein AA313_de0201363 [Arthrobotrys entomopaga]